MSLSAKTVRYLTRECPDALRGKTVLITGATSGIGRSAAEIAVFSGADVILACRNPEKGEAVRASLLREYPGAEISLMRLDLADFSSIDAFAGELRARAAAPDVFVNNAGVFRKPGQKTKNGFDLVLGTNYFGVYRLSEKVLPYLAALPRRVWYINTVSLVHKAARRVDYADFSFSGRSRSLAVYARSKLCLARYTCALAKRYQDSNVRVVMNHPGITVTPLGLNAFGIPSSPLVAFLSRVFNSPEKSALSAFFPVAKDLPAGSLAGPGRFFGVWGYPRENRVSGKVKTGAEELIRFTERAIADAYPSGENPPRAI